MSDTRFKIGQKGFTLLELLLAIMIMAVGLLAVASMQGVALRSNLISNRLTVAATLAQQVAEDVLSYNIADPRVTTAATNQYQFLINPATNATSQQISIAGAGTYQATYAVTPNTGISGNTQIVVTVQYAPTAAGPFTNLVTYTAYKRVN